MNQASGFNTLPGGKPEARLSFVITHTTESPDAKDFNTLSRQKKFKPIHAGKVGMYVCGVTIYDLCHIGHGRTFVAFDVPALPRLFAELRAQRHRRGRQNHPPRGGNHETCDQLTERMLAEMHADFDALLIDRPDQEPRATQHIAEIIEITQRLIDRDHAYGGAARRRDVLHRQRSAIRAAVARIWISCRPARA